MFLLSVIVVIAPDVKADDATPFNALHVIVPNDELTDNNEHLDNHQNKNSSDIDDIFANIIK